MYINSDYIHVGTCSAHRCPGAMIIVTIYHFQTFLMSPKPLCHVERLLVLRTNDYFNPYNNNEKFRSFKSKDNIHKKEIGPYRGFGY